MPATEIHGLEACRYYDDTGNNPINDTFIGESFVFSDSDNVSGILTTPNYPYAYNNKMYCSWQFVLEAWQSIRLNITDFWLETGYEYALFSIILFGIKH